MRSRLGGSALWLVLAALPFLAGPTASCVAQQSDQPAGDTTVVGGEPVTISLVGGPESRLLVVRLGTVGRPAPLLTLDDVAVAVGQTLDQWQKQQVLPERFTIQLGSLDALVLPPLRARLVAPGSNWDMRRGTAKQGSPYQILPAEVLAAIDGTAFVRAFTDRGYRLSPGGAAERVEVGPVAGQGRGLLPIGIGYLPIAAVRAGAP